MSGFREMMFDDWVDKFRPISHQGDLAQLLSDNWYMNDFLYEPENEKKFEAFKTLAKLFPDHIWTYQSQGNEEWVANGYHLINRMGYFFTEHPREPNVEYEINFEPIEEENES